MTDSSNKSIAETPVDGEAAPRPTKRYVRIRFPDRVPDKDKTRAFADCVFQLAKDYMLDISELLISEEEIYLDVITKGGPAVEAPDETDVLDWDFSLTDPPRRPEGRQQVRIGRQIDEAPPFVADPFAKNGP